MHKGRLPTSDTDRSTRVYLTKPVIAGLRAIASRRDERTGRIHAARCFSSIRRLRDRLPLDPMVEVMMAIHDGLSFEDRWLDVGPGALETIAEVLENLLRAKRSNASDVRRAVLRVEAVGIDTTPFEATRNREKLLDTRRHEA